MTKSYLIDSVTAAQPQTIYKIVVTRNNNTNTKQMGYIPGA